MNEGNILSDVKDSIGPMIAGSDAFDKTILSCIDTVLLPLMQLGCIKNIANPIDGTTIWDEVISPPTNSFYDKEATYAAIRQYVGIKTGLLFDPPASSSTLNIRTEVTKELFSRLQEAYDD